MCLGGEVWLGAYENPKEALARATILAEKVISLDDSLAYVHYVSSWIAVVKRDYDKALAVGSVRLKGRFENEVEAEFFGYCLFCFFHAI